VSFIQETTILHRSNAAGTIYLGKQAPAVSRHLQWCFKDSVHSRVISRHFCFCLVSSLQYPSVFTPLSSIRPHKNSVPLISACFSSADWLNPIQRQEPLSLNAGSATFPVGYTVPLWGWRRKKV